MNRQFLLVLCVLAVLASVTSACESTPTQSGETMPPQEPGATATEVPYGFQGLIFMGKVVNPHSGEWTNNRLVLLFLKTKEIARAVTATGKYDGRLLGSNWRGENGVLGDRLDGGLGVIDGLFVMRLPNTYELASDNLGVPLAESPFVSVSDAEIGGFWEGHTGLAARVDPFNEGDTREFYIPSKNLRYVLMVLPGPLSQLPAEIQQPGSIALLEGGRLVAVDPSAPEPAPPSAVSSNAARFDQIVTQVQEFPPTVFPINNCGGSAEVVQEISQTYLHTVIDESKVKTGVEIPLLSWLVVVAEIEHRYGISDKEITTYATTLTVPAGQNIQYTVVRKQTWESGLAVVDAAGVEISAPYRILKSEAFEVANSERKACP